MVSWIYSFLFFQQLFRSQQTQAATPGAAAQLQLLQQQQQQQYLAAAQQQQAAAAAFTQQGPYVLNPQQVIWVYIFWNASYH